MKKIAVFHPSAELYGADRIMVLATKALKQYQPIIYLPKNGDLCELIRQEIPNAEIKIVSNMPIISRALFSISGIVKTAKKYIQFKQFIQKENKAYQFHKIYVNTLACSILLPAFKELNSQIITHVHEILENPKIVAKLTARLAFKYSHTVISVSKAVQDNLHHLTSSKYTNSIIVHNGIPPIKCLTNKKENTLSFYLFGRIKPEKGQWYLLEALKLIPKEELSGTQFNLVGSTVSGKENLKKELKNHIKACKLEDFVKIKGFTNDISGEMSKADVCLVPSLMKDPFPTTVLEGMSAGRVVIATNTGGAQEAINHNKTGFIVPPNSPHILADTIRKVILDRRLMSQIGGNAKAAFDTKFTTKHFNKRWLSAFELV